MGYESLTDEQIVLLLTADKRVTNPASKNSIKPGHNQRNYKVLSNDGHEYTMYVRQNQRIDDDFSCGLLWHMPSGELLTLVRYNGSSHFHPNHIEGTELAFVCHIHTATERYINAGRKPESYAEETNRYTTVDGALHCLANDCRITGLNTTPDHPDLFK